MQDFKGERPSHLFVRFNTLEPGIRAAHVAYARVWVDGGVVERDEEMPPVPIDYDTEDFRSLVSKAQADAIAQSIRLAVEVEDLSSLVTDLRGQIEDANRTASDALVARDEARADMARAIALGEELASAARDRISELEEALAAINAAAETVTPAE